MKINLVCLLTEFRLHISSAETSSSVRFGSEVCLNFPRLSDTQRQLSLFPSWIINRLGRRRWESSSAVSAVARKKIFTKIFIVNYQAQRKYIGWTQFSPSHRTPNTHFLSTRLDSSNFHTFYTHLLRMSDNDANLCVSFPCHTSRVDILNFSTQIWIWDFLSVQKKKRNVGRQTSKKEQRVSVNFSWDLNEIRHTAKEKYFHSCSHARMRIEFCFLFCLVSWRRLSTRLSLSHTAARWRLSRGRTHKNNFLFYFIFFIFLNICFSYAKNEKEEK